MDKKMIEALAADGAKLEALTGERHGPHTLCDDGQICYLPECAFHGCMIGAVCEKCGDAIDMIDGCRCAHEADEL